jgi:Xaa-Pro aminopeptidase
MNARGHPSLRRPSRAPARRHGPRRRGDPHRARTHAQPRHAPIPTASTATSITSPDFPSRRPSLVLIAGDSPQACSSAARRIRQGRSGTATATVPKAARETPSASTRRTHRPARRPSSRSCSPTSPRWLLDIGGDAAWDDRLIAGSTPSARRSARASRARRRAIRDVRAILDEMRLVKDAHEIATMRRAADISAGAHRRAMRATAPGRFEYEIEAELLHEFRRHGRRPGLPTIVAGGANACVLHYVENDRRCGTASCCSSTPAANSTATPPTSPARFRSAGRFHRPQRDVYELVLAAQAAAIAADPCRASLLGTPRTRPRWRAVRRASST